MRSNALEGGTASARPTVDHTFVSGLGKGEAKWMYRLIKRHCWSAGQSQVGVVGQVMQFDWLECGESKRGEPRRGINYLHGGGFNQTKSSLSPATSTVTAA
jgi:hypothetical protein